MRGGGFKRCRKFDTYPSNTFVGRKIKKVKAKDEKVKTTQRFRRKLSSFEIRVLTILFIYGFVHLKKN